MISLSPFHHPIEVSWFSQGGLPFDWPAVFLSREHPLWKLYWADLSTRTCLSRASKECPPWDGAKKEGRPLRTKARTHSPSRIRKLSICSKGWSRLRSRTFTWTCHQPLFHAVMCDMNSKIGALALVQVYQCRRCNHLCALSLPQTYPYQSRFHFLHLRLSLEKVGTRFFTAMPHQLQ